MREGDKFIGVYPGSGYRIEYTIDFPAPIGRQSTCVDLAAGNYGASIAPARTFGYKADEQRLRDMGLIRGAGPQNAIILGKDGPENGPLRFSDEYVRHKVLDLIGDLALAGRRIEGHVVAERAGHAMQPRWSPAFSRTAPPGKWPASPSPKPPTQSKPSAGPLSNPRRSRSTSPPKSRIYTDRRPHARSILVTPPQRFCGV